jgi:hypothetical protein
VAAVIVVVVVVVVKVAAHCTRSGNCPAAYLDCPAEYPGPSCKHDDYGGQGPRLKVVVRARSSLGTTTPDFCSWSTTVANNS